VEEILDDDESNSLPREEEENAEIDYKHPRFDPFYLARDPGFAPLHYECLEYLKVLEPYPQEVQVRRDIIAQITHHVQERYPDATVGVFGSFASGAFLPHGYFSDWTRCCAC
jgi:DNA polymerase sigma